MCIPEKQLGSNEESFHIQSWSSATCLSGREISVSHSFYLACSSFFKIFFDLAHLVQVFEDETFYMQQ
jgi:hypothetical protein